MKKNPYGLFGLRRLLPELRSYRTALLLMLLTSAFGSIVDIGVPLFQRYALNHFVALGTLEGFPLYLFLYLAVILVSALLNYISCIYGMKIELGVDRVLTSGCAPDVTHGIDGVREMVEFAQGAIQILPGAGVNLKNVDRIIEYTGCDQIHVAKFRQYTDPSTANNRDIFYGGALYPPEDRYDVIDGDYISEIRKHL